MLETTRTRLRRFRLTDIDHMVELESDPDIMKFTPSLVPQTREQTEAKLKALVEKEATSGRLGVWAAEEKVTGQFIGWFMLLLGRYEWPELGYMIVKRQWGKNYATEIGAKLVDYGLNELGHRKIVAITTKDNFTSKRVLQKIGFEGPQDITAFNPKLGRDVELDFFEVTKRS